MAFDKKDIGAAWEKTSSRGTPYLSIELELNGEKIKLVAFKNGYKELDKHPDWKIYPSDDQAPQGGSYAPTKTQMSAPAPVNPAPDVEPLDSLDSFAYPEESIDPDDIPF